MEKDQKRASKKERESASIFPFTPQMYVSSVGVEAGSQELNPCPLYG